MKKAPYTFLLYVFSKTSFKYPRYEKKKSSDQILDRYDTNHSSHKYDEVVISVPSSRLASHNCHMS